MKLLITQGEFNANQSLSACTNNYSLVNVNQTLLIYCDITIVSDFEIAKPSLDSSAFAYSNSADGILLPKEAL